MAETRQDVKMWAGDSFTIRIALLDRDGDGLLLPPGSSARWWAGKSPRARGADVYVRKSTDSGIVIESAGSQSTLVVTLDPADTENVAPGNLYHEAEIIDDAGKVSTVTVGRFALEPSMIPFDEA
jgi:hypothetical protein